MTLSNLSGEPLDAVRVPDTELADAEWALLSLSSCGDGSYSSA